jgi:hypothetical protein
MKILTQYIIIVLLFCSVSIQALPPKPLGLSDEWNFSQHSLRLQDNQFQDTLFNFNWYVHAFPSGNNTLIQYAGAGLSLGENDLQSGRNFYPPRPAYALPLVYGWLWHLLGPEPNIYLKTGLEERLYTWQDPADKYHHQQSGYVDIGLVDYWDGHIDFLRDPNERTLLKTFIDYLYNPVRADDYQIRFGMGVYYQIQ